MVLILRSEECLEKQSQFGNLMLQLNSHGRDIQTAGGLSAYKIQKVQKENISPIANIYQGDNYGQVYQAGHQSSFELETNSSVEPTMNDKTHRKAGLKSRTLAKIFSNPWVITIIGGLVIAFLAKFFGWI